VGSNACFACAAGRVALRLDLGRQPPSNRFLKPGQIDEDAHPLILGQCESCGLAQLIDPMPVQMVKSRFEWLRYTEAEGHLDALVERLCKLPQIGRDARILALSDKDETLLERFRRAGRPNTQRIDLLVDLGIVDQYAGLETVQGAMVPTRADAIVTRYGLADLFVARHVLEHAHRPKEFLAACARIVRPGGLIVLEMPDCRKFLEAADHCFLWEEHVSYFTPLTLRNFLNVVGFPGHEVIIFPYALEDSMVALIRNVTHVPVVPKVDADESTRCRKFGELFAGRRREWQQALERLRASGKRMGLFGAGHLAAKFLNLYDIAAMVDLVIDDNSNKKGLEMPGSRVPVVGSVVLDEAKIDLCLLAVSPESEAKIVAAKRAFAEHGGRFASVFRRSPIGLELTGRA
jgi:SAM-dependent methyltransferase